MGAKTRRGNPVPDCRAVIVAMPPVRSNELASDARRAGLDASRIVRRDQHGFDAGVMFTMVQPEIGSVVTQTFTQQPGATRMLSTHAP